VFDALNLPAVVNEAAVQTLLLNQDRCVLLLMLLWWWCMGEAAACFVWCAVCVPQSGFVVCAPPPPHTQTHVCLHNTASL
jgi:hypothetical protein